MLPVLLRRAGHDEERAAAEVVAEHARRVVERAQHEGPRGAEAHGRDDGRLAVERRVLVAVPGHVAAAVGVAVAEGRVEDAVVGAEDGDLDGRAEPLDAAREGPRHERRLQVLVVVGHAERGARRLVADLARLRERRAVDDVLEHAPRDVPLEVRAERRRVFRPVRAVELDARAPVVEREEAEAADRRAAALAGGAEHLVLRRVQVRLRAADAAALRRALELGGHAGF